MEAVRAAVTQLLPFSPELENAPRSLLGCHSGWSLQVRTSLALQPIKPTPPVGTKWVPLRDPESRPLSSIPRNDPVFTTGRSSRCHASGQPLRMWFWEGLRSATAPYCLGPQGCWSVEQLGRETCWPGS